MKEFQEHVTISKSELDALLNEIDRLKRSLERIERYTTYEINGLEFIRDEAMMALDKL